jgi:DNA recombination-mediator protein A
MQNSLETFFENLSHHDVCRQILPWVYDCVPNNQYLFVELKKIDKIFWPSVIQIFLHRQFLDSHVYETLEQYQTDILYGIDYNQTLGWFSYWGTNDQRQFLESTNISNLPCVTYIGSRTPCLNTRRWIAEHAFPTTAVIQTGGAFGVDILISQMAWKKGYPLLYGLPAGVKPIDRYPSAHKNIYKNQEANTLLWSPLVINKKNIVPKQPVFKGQFIQRNHKMIHLSQGAIIVEANPKSGSWDSALYAHKHYPNNTWVVPIPGHIGNQLLVEHFGIPVL